MPRSLIPAVFFRMARGFIGSGGAEGLAGGEGELDMEPAGDLEAAAAGDAGEGQPVGDFFAERG